jgi:large conductance mechanosensitive channel
LTGKASFENGSGDTRLADANTSWRAVHGVWGWKRKRRGFIESGSNRRIFLRKPRKNIFSSGRNIKMLKEFKAFILRGNVLDLAVAVIIGGAFGAIVNSLVKDILMPPLGLILGRVNFGDLFISLNGQTYASLQAAQTAGAPTLNYGLFLQAVVNFLIIAFVIFLITRMATRFQRPQPATPVVPVTKDCPFCWSAIPSKATRCPQCTSDLKPV